MTQGYRCALHQQSFEYFCQRCLQPVCKQCTVIGPHHTQIHSISKINIAYEKKVEQVKSRIDDLIQKNRQKVFKIICQLNSDIEKIDTVRASIEAQNNKQKQRMILNLMKEYENNLNMLQLYRENLISKSNQINDLGYRYENIQNPVQLLGSHNKILQELKELHDRVEIILQKQVEPKQFTKELTDIRIKLKEIQSLNELYQEKLKIIQLIIKKTRQLTKEYGAPPVDYQNLLNELNKHLSSINHLVCHFCGLTFSFQEANKQCLKNNTNINLEFDNQKVGFCKMNPDTNKLGTHRHFFGQPANPLQFYGSQSKGSFKVQLQGLLLKTKALSKQKNINIKRRFQNNDKLKKGQSQKIVFDYIFIEQIGLSQKQKQIIMTLAKQSETGQSFYTYLEIVEKLEEINV